MFSLALNLVAVRQCALSRRGRQTISQSFKYKAFISYSHEDSRWAQWLHKSMERYKPPRALIGKITPNGEVPARLSPIFRDRDDLASSPDLSSLLADALEQAEHLVLICSPDSARSVWTNKEVQTFQKLGRAHRIHCMIVDGDPAAIGTDDDCFPPAIHQQYDANGELLEGIVDPMAADVREGADGKHLAKLKVIAGILGVPLDELRRRESQRRQRLLAGVSIASLVATAFTTFLAIAAITARDEANQRQSQAEELLGYLVGDLRSSLRPMGRLDLLEGVAQRALDYFSSVDVEVLSEQELATQAQVMTQIGEIRIDQFRYEEAMPVFTQAYERSAVLVQKSPTDTGRLFDRAQAEFWIGYIHRTQSDLPRARQWIERYRDSAVEMLALDPTGETALREMAYGHHNLAVLDVDENKLERAREGFQLEIAILERLNEQGHMEHFGEELSAVESWLGRVALWQGDIAAALEYERSAMNHISESAAGRADNVPLQHYIANEMLVYVAIALYTNEPADELEVLTLRAIGILDEITRTDSSNNTWRTDAWRARVLLALVAARSQQWNRALGYAQQAGDGYQLMLDEGLTEKFLFVGLARTAYLQAWIAQVRGDETAAFAHIQRALSALSTVKLSNPPEQHIVSMIAKTQLFYGNALKLRGNIESARAAYNAAVIPLQAYGKAVTSPLLLEPQARYFHAVGDVDAYLAARGQLDAMGFRSIEPWPESSTNKSVSSNLSTAGF
ncbi:MAG: toll/interleukin-1 receptor domain-containing protein [Halioglobus sp.]